MSFEPETPGEGDQRGRHDEILKRYIEEQNVKREDDKFKVT